MDEVSYGSGSERQWLQGAWRRLAAAFTLGMLVLGLTVPAVALAHSGSVETAASVAVIRPTEGARVGGRAELEVSVGAIKHPTEAAYAMDDGVFMAMGLAEDKGVYRAPIDTRILTDGPHVISVRVANRDGLTAQSRVTVIVDNRPPAAAIVSPVEGAALEGLADLKVSAADNEGIASVAFAVDGRSFSPLGLDGAGGLYQGKIDSAALTPGSHVILARATDEAGNAAETAIRVFVDGVRILEPAPGSVLDGPAAIRVLASDHQGVASVGFAVDGGPFRLLRLDGASGLYTGDLDAASLGAGRHAITARVVDALGNSIQDQGSTILVDHAVPVVTILSPNSDRVRDGIQLQVSATDDVGILRVDWRTEGGSSGTMDFIPGSGLYEFNFDTTAEPNGFRLLYFNAIDVSGKSTEVSIEVLIDNSTP